MNTTINEMEIVNGVLLSIKNAQGEVIIPNEVTKIADNVFCQKHEVTAVRGENVTECGGYNFRNNAKLIEIALPNLRKCGDWNFSCNVKLEEIALPKLAKCGDWNFRYNSNLEEISLPKLATCGNWNFNDNDNLREIALTNLASCGYENFRENDKLAKIALPKLVKCGDWNFRNNANLSKINGQKVVCIDGITSVLLSKKGNVFKAKTLLKVENNILVTEEEVVYIVTDGNGNYAHGTTIKEAKADLIYKIVGRNVDDYKHLSMNSILTHEESITCYRTITGACAYGTREFVENILNGDKKEKYTIKEICKITENHYGNENFKKFFQK